MTVTFDGESIIHNPKPDFDRYAEWRRRRAQDDAKILSQETMTGIRDAVRRWIASIPVVYRSASIDGIAEYDPAAADIMKTIADKWERTGIPQSVIITSTTGKRGKTWALWAWLKELVARGIIPIPEHQIAVLQESDVMNRVFSFDTRSQTLRDIFTPERLVLGIDGCGAIDRSARVRKDVWALMIEAIHDRRDFAFACTLTRSTIVGMDTERIMAPVIRRSAIIDLVNEPDGIRAL